MFGCFVFFSLGVLLFIVISLVVSTGASDSLARLVSEMTYGVLTGH